MGNKFNLLSVCLFIISFISRLLNLFPRDFHFFCHRKLFDHSKNMFPLLYIIMFGALFECSLVMIFNVPMNRCTFIRMGSFVEEIFFF